MNTETEFNCAVLLSAQSTKPETDSCPQPDQEKSLDEIAEDLIGDTELEEVDDDTSAVSEAKQRARNQGRDPAIDPEFQ
jgi:hypothetical protein